MKKRFLLPSIALLLAMIVLFSSGGGGTASAQIQGRQTQLTLAHPAAPSLPEQLLNPSVYVWGTNVNARYSSPLGISMPSCHYFPSTSCPVEGHFTQQTVTAICQQAGQTVTAEGITNNWWSLIIGFGTQVWVSNIYIRGGQKIDGVPDCNFTP
ncbi:MAG TPA: hypothetical protein VGF67_12445 [Ktedonobacteraceae bacterium]